jgi:site-specific DNA-methyltransferase (adenine-specific)
MAMPTAAGETDTARHAVLSGCTPLVVFDPQFRAVTNELKYGNEGARQSARVALPQMADSYIEACCREVARVLAPSGYLMLWADINVCQAHHLRVADVLPCVDLIAWDNERIGNGYRSRRRGSYLVILQKPPLKAKDTWGDHAIPDRWIEKIDRRIHPHIKPAGLIKRLIGAVTKPGDLIVDPAAGSFVAMHAAHELGRRFIGCDLMYGQPFVGAPVAVGEGGMVLNTIFTRYVEQQQKFLHERETTPDNPATRRNDRHE